MNNMQNTTPARLATTSDLEERCPVYAVWEVTLACDQRCSHCGSRAGRKRASELTTDEALNLLDDLGQLGTREITFIGGEAYLRKDLGTLVSHAKGLGIRASMQTGGRNLDQQRLLSLHRSGLDAIGVSVDGLRETHDSLRGVRGSYNSAIDLIDRCNTLQLPITVNSQICRPTINELDQLLDVLIEHKVSHWQVQLTVAMGNAADNSELLLQPYEVLELIPRLAELQDRGSECNLLLVPGNNIGYFGPYEKQLRQHTEFHGVWEGCSAGQTVIGIEADGTIKGCPSLATMSYSGGNVRNKSLIEIWQQSWPIRFREGSSLGDQTWGYCGSCYYREVCSGGCTWTSQSLLGHAGNNPYCFYRARDLDRRGLREVVRQTQSADVRSFGIGRFELILQTKDGHHVETSRSDAVPIFSRPAAVTRAQRRLVCCPECHEYCFDDEKECPNCSVQLADALLHEAIEAKHRQDVIREVESLLNNDPKDQ